MAYWCQKYWEYDKKCELRTRLQKSNGDVVDAVFERPMPSNLKHPETVVDAVFERPMLSNLKHPETVVDAVFERPMPSNLKYPETVAAVDYLKEICAKCKGQR